MFYHFKIHKEGSGYWAECMELDGCQTQADSLRTLRKNMERVLNLYLSEPENSKLQFPMPLKRLPKHMGSQVEKVHVEPNVAFAMILRQTRLKNKLTLRQMADLLEYKNINTYVKLEKAETSNPQLKTMANIIKHFSEFPVALIF
jgi:antitoxin HicB